MLYTIKYRTYLFSAVRECLLAPRSYNHHGNLYRKFLLLFRLLRALSSVSCTNLLLRAVESDYGFSTCVLCVATSTTLSGIKEPPNDRWYVCTQTL